jgi:hypothetical protein
LLSCKEKNSLFKEQWNVTCNKKDKKPKTLTLALGKRQNSLTCERKKFIVQGVMQYNVPQKFAKP